MEDIPCVLSLASSCLAPKFCTISFNLATLPSNSKFKVLLYFSPKGMFYVYLFCMQLNYVSVASLPTGYQATTM